jgi:hypothetical protein
MGAHFQPIAGVVRVGRQFKAPPDPYEASFTVVIDGERAHLIGASTVEKDLFLACRRQIAAALEPYGVRVLAWERMGDDRTMHPVEIRIGGEDGPV